MSSHLADDNQVNWYVQPHAMHLTDKNVHHPALKQSIWIICPATDPEAVHLTNMSSHLPMEQNLIEMSSPGGN